MMKKFLAVCALSCLGLGLTGCSDTAPPATEAEIKAANDPIEAMTKAMEGKASTEGGTVTDAAATAGGTGGADAKGGETETPAPSE